MEIKVLGSGCSKCTKLYDMVSEVIAEKQLDASITKIEDFKEILGFGVMKTPALVIDENVIFSGSVPNKKKIEEYLSK